MLVVGMCATSVLHGAAWCCTCSLAWLLFASVPSSHSSLPASPLQDAATKMESAWRGHRARTTKTMVEAASRARDFFFPQRGDGPKSEGAVSPDGGGPLNA